MDKVTLSISDLRVISDRPPNFVLGCEAGTTPNFHSPSSLPSSILGLLRSDRIFHRVSTNSQIKTLGDQVYVHQALYTDGTQRSEGSIPTQKTQHQRVKLTTPVRHSIS
ncbi:hypothetical protein NPIL_437961 [Nephila pilipes]|uniref:Uncharacterized protein n=1 Tax=Nephila pilipes TaxID=299642 RepID=A0A8X6M7F7_NEPPI|nr:hypothetical protein NPIL_437961 [Nephila pilipes]